LTLNSSLLTEELRNSSISSIAGNFWSQEFPVFLMTWRNKMADIYELNAEPRTDVGKGASRRLRRLSDLVPAVIYGGDAEAQSISLLHKDIHRALENEAFYSRIVTIKTGKHKDEVILKDLQRHPAKDRIMHVDFQRVSKDRKITVQVPIHFLNEQTCVGVKRDGGAISHLLSEIQVECLPADLPEFIEVDMANAEVGDAVHLSDLTMPAGVDIVALTHGEPNDQTVAAVNITREHTEEDEVLEGEEPEVSEEPEEPEED
jgi:large subunit ribosomal protein L25